MAETRPPCPAGRAEAFDAGRSLEWLAGRLRREEVGPGRPPAAARLAARMEEYLASPLFEHFREGGGRFNAIPTWGESGAPDAVLFAAARRAYVQALGRRRAARLAACPAVPDPPPPPTNPAHARYRVEDIEDVLMGFLFRDTAPAPARYLDVGCARAGMTLAIGRKGLGLEAPGQLFACDDLPAAPAWLAPAGGGAPGVEYATVADGRMPYPAAHFQYVSCAALLHACAAPAALLADVRRVLAPGGVLILLEFDCAAGDECEAAYLDFVRQVDACVLAAGRPQPAGRYRPAAAWRDFVAAQGFRHARTVRPRAAAGRPAAPACFYSFFVRDA